MTRKYLSDLISDTEIDSWTPGDSVLIVAPTGSGKSRFVLDRLLPRAIRDGKLVVYLCNRKILDEQFTVMSEKILKELSAGREGITEEENHFLEIFTYQYLEKCNIFPAGSTKDITLKPEYTMYYVFDESHYFLADALFNSGTHVWLNKIESMNSGIASHAVKIFLTATPEPLQWGLASSKFRMDRHMQNMVDCYRDLAACRRTTHEWVRDQYGFEKKVTYSQREILERCRNIEVYTPAIRDLSSLSHSLPCKTIAPKSLISPYKQMVPHYFSQYADLLPLIIDSQQNNEKWLIFIDSERDGDELAAELRAHGISSVLLSRTSLKKHASAKKAFHQIVEKQAFGCNALLATKILDCGVNITDQLVRHIVLAHHEKTTFLQMLGRRRLQEHEQVDLYIRYYSERQIYGIRHSLETQLHALTFFALRNDFVGKFGGREEEMLSVCEKNWAIDQIFLPQNQALTYFVPVDSYESINDKRYARRNNSILEERKHCKTAFLALLYQLSEYMAALDDYRETQDPCFFLKRQLAWLGKEYDERCWVTYAQTRRELLDYLQENCGGWLDKAEQNTLSVRCLELLLALPVPPATLKKTASRYRDKTGAYTTGPGLKRLNEALAEKEIPYLIQSKQRSVSGKGRGTYWRIVPYDRTEKEGAAE